MKNIQKDRGITLVALVITIIILLILAGITISQLTGSGLFEKAKLAEEKSKNTQEKEEGIVDDYLNKIGEYVEGSRDTVTIDREKYEMLQNEIETLKSENSSLTQEIETLISQQISGDMTLLGEVHHSGAGTQKTLSYTFTSDTEIALIFYAGARTQENVAANSVYPTVTISGSGATVKKLEEDYTGTWAGCNAGIYLLRNIKSGMTVKAVKAAGPVGMHMYLYKF